jgi:acyl carrier protein
MQLIQFVRNFENAIEGIEPESLTPETHFHTIPQMDSLGLLCLLAMVDCEYDVQVPGMRIKACVTLADIYDLITAKQAEKTLKAA